MDYPNTIIMRLNGIITEDIVQSFFFQNYVGKMSTHWLIKYIIGYRVFLIDQLILIICFK